MSKSEVIAVSWIRRGKTVIPKEVREHLGVKDWDKLLWLKMGDEIVVRGTR